MLIPREAVQKLKKLHDLLVTEVAHSWSATEIENRKALMMVLEKKNNDNNRETAEDWKYLQWKSILMENYCRPKAREVDSTFNFSSLLSWYDESPPEQASTNSEKLVLQALKKSKSSQIIVFVNGILRSDLSSFSSISGLEIHSFAKILSDANHINHLNSSQLSALYQWKADLSESVNPLSLLNNLMYEDGIFLRVDPDFQMETPLNIFHLVTDEENIAVFPRHYFILENHAKLRMNLIYSGISSKKYLSNVAGKILLKEGAQLELVHLQDEAPQAYHISEIQADLDSYAYLKSLFINLGGLQSRQVIKAKARGEGTSVKTDGISLTQKDQRQEFRTEIHHEKAQGQSQQLFKSVATDKSQVVFRGKIVIDKNAQKVDSSQMTRSLLLNSGAEIDAQPILEIMADDVKASHGATIGQLDPEQIFYLRSRGIPLGKAIGLLTEGFVSEVLDFHLHSTPEDQILRDILRQWLNQTQKEDTI